MTEAEIEQTKEQFVEAAKRALKAGYDGIEIHMAHGKFTRYLGV
jgi:2,4-dienoyl-CoA reductase-like NADH-dependent reductase (Old Yellow Enzyme family)